MTLRHALSLKEERLFFYLRYCKYAVDLPHCGKEINIKVEQGVLPHFCKYRSVPRLGQITIKLSVS